MKILCIAQCEDRTNLDKQILKQTIQPDRVVFYIDKTPETHIEGEHPSTTVERRRKRIAENHKILKTIVDAYGSEYDLIWQVEQDGDYPADCLERLLNRYDQLKTFISGIQVGRHGVYCLGAWRNFTANQFESLDYRLEGIQKVDAVGFYCILAPVQMWLSGEATWNGEPYGPDVNFCFSIKANKYVDMDIKIGHIIKSGIIRPEHESTCNVKFIKNNGKWEYKQL